MSARLTTLEKVEALATELYGKGTAISVDHEDGRWCARVWNAQGGRIVEQGRNVEASAVGKTLAIGLLLAVLRVHVGAAA